MERRMLPRDEALSSAREFLDKLSGSQEEIQMSVRVGGVWTTFSGNLVRAEDDYYVLRGCRTVLLLDPFTEFGFPKQSQLVMSCRVGEEVFQVVFIEASPQGDTEAL